MGIAQVKHLSQGQYEELDDEIRQLDQVLQAAGGSSAERAFSLGCGIGLLPLILMLGLLLFFKVINLILFFILLTMGLLALVGLTMLAAYRARSNAIQRIYLTEVEEKIDLLLKQYSLDRPIFDTMAWHILPPDAPLQSFLKPTMPDARNILCG